jgi:mannosyltransferase OCH1-like enzyme
MTHYIYNKNNQSLDENCTVTKEKSYHYIDDFPARIEQEGIKNIPKLFEFLEKDFKSKLPIYNQPDEADLSMDSKIPDNTHMIYLFKDHAQKQLSENNIEKIIRTSKELSRVQPNYVHMFWTNNQDNIDVRIKDLANLKFMDINELSEHKIYPIYKKFLNAANNDNNPVPHLTQASDALRLMVLQIYGGIYHDCDYEIFQGEYIYNLGKQFSLLLTQESSDQKDAANFFIAAKPNHIVINNAIDLIYRNFNEKPPVYVLHALDKINKLVFETGPCVLTAALLKYVQQVENDLAENDFMYFLSGGLSNHILARSMAPYPSQESCRNQPFDIVQEKMNFEGIEIVSAGADLLCGSWGETADFSRPIEYYNVLHNNQQLECSSEAQYNLLPSEYSLVISGDDNCALYQCGHSLQS